MKPKLYYDFEHDLRKIILRGIKNYGIRSKITLEPDIIHLLAKWFEILDKLVESVPRSVHMSREIKTSLINLGISQREIEAKYMVSELCRKFKIGIEVTPWLSKKVLHDSTDQMLLQYGLHHFHLSSSIGEDGFSIRSDYLLFAHILSSDVYLVDLKLHKHSGGLRWVDQELPKIMYQNWPELFTKISGVEPPTVTDKEKRSYGGRM
ncbi:MAG: hypothetical protein OXE59_07620 [Bacteroidetes bacterium]|nr:hypothetical protein [Bacteroidota bacterium]